MMGLLSSLLPFSLAPTMTLGCFRVHERVAICLAETSIFPHGYYAFSPCHPDGPASRVCPPTRLALSLPLLLGVEHGTWPLWALPQSPTAFTHLGRSSACCCLYPERSWRTTGPPSEWLSYFSHYCLTTKASASFSLLGLQSFPSRIIAVTLLGFCQRLCQRICRHLFSLEVLNGYDLISYEIFK
eukprot:scaffold2241_cov204-Ochromonas_danica.AAC.1